MYALYMGSSPIRPVSTYPQGLGNRLGVVSSVLGVVTDKETWVASPMLRFSVNVVAGA